MATSNLIRKGSKGPAVTVIQQALSVSPTGVFDAATEAAVKVFQKNAGIKADGIVGDKTREKLNEHLEKMTGQKDLVTQAVAATASEGMSLPDNPTETDKALTAEEQQVQKDANKLATFLIVGGGLAVLVSGYLIYKHLQNKDQD